MVGCLLQASLNAMKQNLLYTTILTRAQGLWRWPPQVMQRRVSRSTAAAFACLAATVEALTAMPALVPVPRAPLRHAQRSRTLFADVAAGWTTRADPNGDTYYFNEQTGQSQWELPQQAPGAPMLWRVVPATALSVKAILLLGTLSAVECLRHQTFFQFSLAHLPIVHPHKVL